MEVKLSLPDIEGFEIADGEQPRLAKSGDYYMGMNNHAVSFKDPRSGYTVDKFIILKEKAPDYRLIQIRSDGQWAGFADSMFKDKFVEIKVLEDALSMVDENLIEVGGREDAMFQALKKLTESK